MIPLQPACSVFPLPLLYFIEKLTGYDCTCVQPGLVLLKTANTLGHLTPTGAKGFTLMLFEGKKHYQQSAHSLERSNGLEKH